MLFRLDDVQIGLLLDLVARLKDTSITTAFAARPAHADGSALLDHLFTRFEEQENLDLQASFKLRRALADWRRSRSQ
ncbi:MULTISPECIES: hypothetical protein [unclassified Streptomyces]|uniref:hypothetical protein n=1 Tax=unclassified Streptomyces TaxID=2593676 RepID=UPI0006AF57F0|nr:MULTISPECIES: hypothetical protein [unclassified Streptomyces]KOX31588.1 hypothetical protein ADL06_10740 [Streptomyces sp. NRRL F-6491]KOX48075.1 hypothetical protein ADL08_11490 [Streptomyces sp. NRRL F-6492]